MEKKTNRIVQKSVRNDFILQYQFNLTYADKIWVNIHNGP